MLSLVFPCCRQGVLSPTSEQRDCEVHKLIPDLYRSPAHSFIRQGVCVGGGRGVCECVLIKAQMKAHVAPTTVLALTWQQEQLEYFRKAMTLGHLSTSLSLSDLLHLMGTRL